LTARRNEVWRDEGTLFADALLSSPEAPLLWNNLGVFHSRALRHGEAVECLSRALSLSGRGPRQLVNLAAALRSAGRFEESLELLDEALAGGRLPAAIRHNRGKTLLAMGNARAAAVEFEAALKLRPGRIEIMADLAEACKSARDYARAERIYLDALALHPAGAALWSNLGVVRKLAGDPGGARAAFENSLRLEPDSSAARGNLGVLLARMGLYPEALKELQAARSLDPGNLDAANALGVLFAQTAKEAEAEELFLELARARPESPDSFVNLGILKFRQGRQEEAGAWFARARSLAPADPRVAAFFSGPRE
jgi:Flp pilus assembly protein TadD